jgi:hypothetical protein
VIFDQVEIPVREQQPDIDVRVSGQKLGDDGQDMQASEEDRSCQNQLATRDMEFASSDPFGLVDLIEDASGRSNVGGAGVGQSHFASRADQKACPEMLLELAHLAADGRQRQTQITAGGRKASPIHYLEEDRHGFEAVHDYSIPRELYSQ